MRHASTDTIGAQIFNMDGLVVRARHANVSGQYLSSMNA
jgi:hypothetical protein